MPQRQKKHKRVFIKSKIGRAPLTKRRWVRVPSQLLVSFQLASKHPDKFVELLDNLERTASDPGCFEVLVKVDIEDKEMVRVVKRQAASRRCSVRYLATPRGEGYAGLWRALNELYAMTHPDVYFVCCINDELWIREQGWDSRLRRYRGLFPDHIFRLRTSQLKFRNYYDRWECGYAPEGLGFYTRRWLEIVGDWNPCFGPDNSQQYIAYYLGYANYPGFRQFNRDVPILDISWGGEGASVGLTEEQQIRRIAINFRLWMRQVSHPMQEEYFRRARLLQANIMRANYPGRELEISTERRTRSVIIHDRTTGELVDILPYRLSRIRLFFGNLIRTSRFTYYGGGGREAWNFLPLSIIEFILYYFPDIRLGYRWLLRSINKFVSLMGSFRTAAQPKRTRPMVINLNPLRWVFPRLHFDARRQHLGIKARVPRRAVPSWAMRTLNRAMLPVYVEINPLHWALIIPLRWVFALIRRISRPLFRSVNHIRWVVGNAVSNIHHYSRRLAWAIHLRDMRWLKIDRPVKQVVSNQD